MLTAEKLIQTLPYEQQAMMHKLRELVLKADPTIVETIKWGAPVYSRGKNLLSMIPEKSHDSLKIWDGAALADKYPAIQGEGPGVRHLKVKYKGRNDFKTITAVISDVIKCAK